MPIVRVTIMTTVLTAVPGSPPWDLPHPEARIRVAPGLWVGMGSPMQPSGGKAAWAPLLDASPVGMASFLRRSPWCPGLCRCSPQQMPLPDRASCRRCDKQLVHRAPRFRTSPAPRLIFSMDPRRPFNSPPPKRPLVHGPLRPPGLHFTPSLHV